MSDEPKLGVRVRGKDGDWYLLDISAVREAQKTEEGYRRSVEPVYWLEWLRGAVIEPGPGTDCLDV